MMRRSQRDAAAGASARAAPKGNAKPAVKQAATVAVPAAKPAVKKSFGKEFLKSNAPTMPEAVKSELPGIDALTQLLLADITLVERVVRGLTALLLHYRVGDHPLMCEELGVFRIPCPTSEVDKYAADWVVLLEQEHGKSSQTEQVLPLRFSDDNGVEFSVPGGAENVDAHTNAGLLKRVMGRCVTGKLLGSWTPTPSEALLESLVLYFQDRPVERDIFLTLLHLLATVVQHAETNRMTGQNVGIVFGNLLYDVGETNHLIAGDANSAVAFMLWRERADQASSAVAFMLEHEQEFRHILSPTTKPAR